MDLLSQLDHPCQSFFKSLKWYLLSTTCLIKIASPRSPDGECILSNGEDNMVRIHDRETLRVKAQVQEAETVHDTNWFPWMNSACSPVSRGTLSVFPS